MIFIYVMKSHGLSFYFLKNNSKQSRTLLGETEKTPKTG